MSTEKYLTKNLQYKLNASNPKEIAKTVVDKQLLRSICESSKIKF